MNQNSMALGGKGLRLPFQNWKRKSTAEYYQADRPGQYYIVPSGHRKLTKERADELAKNAFQPTSPTVVVNPWQNYDRDWDWIQTISGICLNYAGCLDQEEINRREDEGVARSMELIASLLRHPSKAPISVALIRQLHIELMGSIYPFAGEWRSVSLHKGDGATKWPLPLGGIQPVIDIFDRDVLSRTPFLSNDDHEVFAFVSELMNEFLVIHPFREGNGREAFVLGNMILMQNDLLPLDVYDPRRHQDKYYEACEAGRLRKDYRPLAELISDWESEALRQWEESNG